MNSKTSKSASGPLKRQLDTEESSRGSKKPKSRSGQSEINSRKSSSPSIKASTLKINTKDINMNGTRSEKSIQNSKKTTPSTSKNITPKGSKLPTPKQRSISPAISFKKLPDKPNDSILRQRQTRSLQEPSELEQSKRSKASMHSSKKASQTSFKFDIDQLSTKKQDYVLDSSSETNSSDDDFDVILSPEVLTRLKEQNQKTMNATNLSKESEFIVSSKVDEWKRDRLEKEFKCLFYRTREISELLLSSEKRSSSLEKKADESNSLCAQVKQKYKHAKEIISELKKDLTDKTSQLQNLKIKSDSTFEEVERLRKSEKEVKSQAKNLETQFEQIKAESQKENAQLTEKVRNLKSTLAGKNSEEGERQNSYDSLKIESTDRIIQLEKEIYQLRESSRKAIEASEAEVQSVNDEIIRVQQSYQEQFNQLRDKDTEISNMLSQTVQDRDELEKKLKATLQDKTNLEKESERANQLLIKTKDENRKTKEELASVQIKFQNSLGSLEDTQRKLKDAKREIGEKETEIARMRNTIYEDKITAENSSISIQQAELTINSLRKELASWKGYRDSAESESLKLKEDLLKLERENKQLQSELQQQQFEASKFRDQGIRSDEQLKHELEMARQAKLESEAKLKKKEAKVNKQKNEMEATFQKLNQQTLLQENDLLLHRRSNQEQLTQISNLERELHSLQQQVHIATEDKAKAEQIIQNLEKEKNQQQAQLRARIEFLESQAENLEVDNEGLKNKILFSKYETKRMKENFTDKENKLRSTYEGQIEQYQLENEHLAQRSLEDQGRRKLKDSKIKVISDIKDLIKEHKDKLKEYSPN